MNVWVVLTGAILEYCYASHNSLVAIVSSTYGKKPALLEVIKRRRFLSLLKLELGIPIRRRIGTLISYFHLLYLIQ